MSVMKFPANPFPGEPLDSDPGMQAGDPGAVPPPANLEPEPDPISDPLTAMIMKLGTQMHEALQGQDRLTMAFNEQISAVTYSIRSMKASIRWIKPGDIRPGNLLIRELHHEAQALVEVLAPMCTKAD